MTDAEKPKGYKLELRDIPEKDFTLALCVARLIDDVEYHGEYPTAVVINKYQQSVFSSWWGGETKPWKFWRGIPIEVKDE